jgi:hypothetical protein
MFAKKRYCSQQDVAAIITAMTDAEEQFLYETLKAAIRDEEIGQIILCVDQKNTWVDAILDRLGVDTRLKLIRLPLMPLGAVRNRALEHVTLSWVAYCDGDDVWCMGKTAIQRRFANTTHCDFVGADHYLTDEKGRICAAAPARYIPMPSSWMVKTEVMRQHPFHELPFSLHQEESGEWWLRTSNAVSKARCPRLLLRYRIRANSLSARTPSMQRKAQIVGLATIPGLRIMILLLTGGFRLFSLSNKYVWQKDWGEKTTADSISEHTTASHSQ